MGGQGKTVIISDDLRNRFTKDGVTVAKSISFEDIEENIGAKMVQSASGKTVSQVGDGTTATACLLQGFVNEIYNSDVYDYSGNLYKTLKMLDSQTQKVEKALQEMCKKVTDVNTNHIRNIAATSGNDERIGELFRAIYKATGQLDSKVILERSEESPETYFEVRNGLTFNNGYLRPAFMTDKKTEQAIYENAYVHVTDREINGYDEKVSELLKGCVEQRIPLVLIAYKFTDGFIRQIVLNKTQQDLPILLIEAPGWGNGMTKNLQDINAFLDEDNYVDKIICDPVSFTLFNEETPRLQSRIEHLESLIENSIDSFEENDMINRIYRLKGASVILYAGGQTPESREEEYDRLEDAIGAVTAAVNGGYVLGAGKALYEIATSGNLNDLFSTVLKRPAISILRNANLSPELLKDLKKGEIINVITGSVEKRSTIIDPYEVVLNSLKNAVATTKLILNSEYILHNNEPDTTRNLFNFKA